MHKYRAQQLWTGAWSGLRLWVGGSAKPKQAARDILELTGTACAYLMGESAGARGRAWEMLGFWDEKWDVPGTEWVLTLPRKF